MTHTGRATVAADAVTNITGGAAAPRSNNLKHPQKEAPAGTPRHVAHSPAFPPLRTAVHSHAAAALPLTSLSSPMPSFGASIQSRPLLANPSHPLLWNSVTSTATSATTATSVATTPAAVLGGRGTAPSSVPRQTRAGSRSNTGGVAAVGESAERGLFYVSANTPPSSTASTPRSSNASGVVSRDGRVPPQQQPQQRTAAAAALAGHGAPRAQAPAARADKGRRGVPAVNYNALLLREEQQQPQEGIPVQGGPLSDTGTGVWPPAAMVSAGLPPPSSDALARHAASPLDAAVGLRSSPLPLLQPPSSSSLAATTTTTTTTTTTAVVEGPLPPDVRRLIAQSCGTGADGSDAAVDAAEQQARRLISTGRRVKVYREELAAAEEERRDLAATTEQHELVRGVLQTEVDDLNARIQALLQERALCEAQLQAEDDAAARDARKLSESQERVTVLRQTIDGIVEETMVGRLMLRQQVPGLHLENYY